MALVGLVIYLKRRRSKMIKENMRISSLVSKVLEHLANQEIQHYNDPVTYPQLYIPSAHLRDMLLPDIHDPVRRTMLWSRVARIIENNSNIRCQVREIKGEPHRIWEWVGTAGKQFATR